MSGLVALAGSGEYLPVMEDVDRYLLASCGADARTLRVTCLPTAAGQEGDASIDRWSRMGEAHFTKLGASVRVARITNRSEADDPRWVDMLVSANLVYFSGGDPRYLLETMRGSKAWQAIEEARVRGAVYAGCSAGAMILGDYIPDFRTLGLRQVQAFGQIPKASIFPHFDRMMGWRAMLMPLIQSRLTEGDYTIGIDEDTVLVGTLGGSWQVLGRQKVHLITKKNTQSFAAGQQVPLPPATS